jgi:Abnormal spindle-like microcephaly-assoc'd, ASPM-SPD-2-Hydin
VPLSGTGTAPAVTLNPTSLSFGNQVVNTTSAAQPVTLINGGTAPLTISSISVTGTNSGDFAETSTCPISPSTLAAGAQCTINVTFRPSATGSRSASLSITDNAAGSPQTAPLSGTGTAPAVTLNPTSLSFGNQLINTTSPAQTVTLTNSGTAPLTISSIGDTGTNAGDFTETNTCPISPSTLAAGAQCTINVTFRPSATGSRSASLSITDNAAGSPQIAPLSGTGTAPAVSLSPSNLSFGNQLVNTTSAVQTISLIDSGTAPLTISGFNINGPNAGNFAQSNNCPISPSTLPVNASCTISVTFTPSATGSRSANLRISDNAANSPQTVALSGIGTAPVVSLSPTSLSFGSQAVNTTSPAQTITLTNTGTAPLTISGITINGANAGDFAQTNTCPSSLAVGASCTISVTFKPAATGNRKANLNIADNAAGSPQQVALNGKGV